MRLIFLGAPGAGKGTYALLLSQKLGILTISTGDLLRANVKEKTALGLEAKAYMDKGALVPDDLVTRMLGERLVQDDVKGGYILDGFPRTLPQAQSLDALLKKTQQELTAVVNIQVPQEVIIRRLTGRRMCPTCGANFNVNTNLKPKREGRCDRCGATLIVRSDDNEATIAKRLQVYEQQTAPLVDYYAQGGWLRSVEAQGSIPDIVDKIHALVSK